MADEKPRVLIQLDADAQPSVFDSIVAIDSGVEQLLRHGGVTPGAVRGLVFGALFTRGKDELRRTAIFVGGSDVEAGEAILRAVLESFFADFRVSVMLDANGANTTAAAAVLAAIEGMGGSLEGKAAAVLGGTGPVGHRVARLLARAGANVSLGSRKRERAEAVADTIQAATTKTIVPFAARDAESLRQSLENVELVVAAGAAGAVLLPEAVRASFPKLKVAIDLNAVPPLGIEGLSATDKGKERNGLKTWGALGVGGTKMKIHRRAIRELFTSNDKVLDAEQILELGKSLG